MALSVVGIQGEGTPVGLQRRGEIAAAPLHQAQVVPGEGHFRRPLGGGLGEADRFLQAALIHQSSRQVEAGSKTHPCVQRNLQGLPVAVHRLVGITGGQGQSQVQQQFIPFGTG